MAWYQVKGNETDVVVSSRIRLARNLTGYPFEEKLKKETAEELIDRIGGALGEEFTRTDMTVLSPTMASALVE